MNKRFYPGQTESHFFGKVRIVSPVLTNIGEILITETTDNISAFDRVLPFKVPYKGAILNLIAAKFLEETKDIIPNCLLDVPHPRVQIWQKTIPFKFEVKVRGYNAKKSFFYRNYIATGKENPWGYKISKKIKDNQKFPKLLLTPTIKAEKGKHDEDISREEIIKHGLATEKELQKIEATALKLFERGQKIAKKLGLILVDTKYEFGKDDKGNIYLIDEVHTPDSSRYWYLSTYRECIEKGEEPVPLSKEFVRQWLIDYGFQGNKGQKMPKFSKKFIKSISDRYLELFKQMGFSLSELKGEDAPVYIRVCEFLKRT